MSVKLSMLKSYPLLIPNLNFTIWQGYIKVMGNDYKITISCPEFPFTRNISLKLDTQLSNLLPNCNSIINQLKLKRSLKLNKFLDNFAEYLKNNTSNSSIDFNSKYLLYKDLETVRDNIMDISDTMDLVTLEYMDGADRSHSISIHLQPGAGKYFDMDLPEEICHVFSEVNRLNTVSGAYEQFCQRVTDLQALFFMCDLLDEQTTVLEPANPSRKHVHRKIGLSESVAVEIRLNPYDVYSCPGLEVVGEGTSVANVKTTLEQNMKEIGWDEDLNIIENLTRVLVVEEFPDLQSRLVSTQAQLGEGECSICLSMRHATTLEAPVKLCSNQKCSSFYHELCLSKWLQSVPTSDMGFGMVTGKCPLCKTTISCRLLDDDEDD